MNIQAVSLPTTTLTQSLPTTKPDHTNYNPDRSIRDQYWLDGNKLHNDNGPARIAYYKTGEVESIYYYVNDKLISGLKPSIIEFYKTGKVKTETWTKDGLKHTEITYTPTGKIKNAFSTKNERNIFQDLVDANYFETDDQEMKDVIWEML